MALLGGFVLNHVLALLEKELLNHAPEAQALLLAEAQDLLAKGSDWLAAKIAEVAPK